MIEWRSDTGHVALVAACGADDAEPLLQLLLAHRNASIDWRECDSAHSSIVQLMLAAGRSVVGPPRDEFLTRWVEPHFTAR